MKAQVLHRPGEPFVLEERPDPVAGPGEAVARVLACGAGLTTHLVRAGRADANFPIVLGHEITGEIVEVGPTDGPAALAVGDAVTVYFYLIDGDDKWTRLGRDPISTVNRGYVGRQVDGGYAEYVKLPIRNFVRLPDGLDPRGDAAAIGVITDAVATPYKVLSRARIAPTDTVVVFGAGGGLGLHQVMMCKWAHATVIAVDVAPHKLAACTRHGADAVVDASAGSVVEQVLDLTQGRGTDVAVDYVSSTETQEQAIACLGIGGRFVTLGGPVAPFTVPGQQLMAKELELMGSRYCSRQQVIEALELCARGEVWPIVTETYPLAEAEALHQRLDDGLVTGRAALLVAGGGHQPTG